MSFEHANFWYKAPEASPKQSERIAGNRDTTEEHEGVEKNAQIPEKLLKKLESSGADMEKFGIFLPTLPAEKQAELFQVISSVNILQLKRYVKENGFIINNNTMDTFLAQYGKSEAEISAKRTKTETETDRIEEDTLKTEEQIRQQFQHHVEMFKWKNGLFEDIPEFHNLVTSLNDVAEDASIEEIEAVTKQFIAFFSTSSGVEQVAQTLYNQAKAEGADPLQSETYKQYRSYLGNLDSSGNYGFTARLDTFEKYADKNAPDIESPLFQAQVRSAHGDSKVTKYGQYLESQNGNFTTTTNMADVPPSRQLSLTGSPFQLDAPVAVGDFYKAVSKEGLAYETTHKENTEKLTIMENISKALAEEDIANETIRSIELILQNDGILPLAMTLADVFGRSFSSGAELQAYISNGQYGARKKELEKQIEDKKHAYEVALAQHQKAYQEAQREADEKIKQTLRILKNTGMDLWDMDYFLAQVKNGLIRPQIGKPVERQNFDIAQGNFWEPRGIDNPTAHIEYIYRMANMAYTGTPEWIVDGKQAGFPIDQAILAPDAALKTESEVKNLMIQSGVWSETTGINKAKLKERLEKAPQKNG